MEVGDISLGVVSRINNENMATIVFFNNIIGMANDKIIRLLLQGMVAVNNLGPDRLAGPKAIDPNHCRQPTL